MSIPKTERVDAAGRLWPAGTEMSPLSSGYDNVRGAEQRVFVERGREVVFYDDAKSPAA